MSAAAWDEALLHLATVGDSLRFLATRFSEAPLHFGHGTDEPWDEAVHLVVGTLRLPADRLQALLGARLLPSEVARLLTLGRRRVEDRVPVAYLTGRAWFAGMEFEVDPRVLIPRSPIAELVEHGFEPWVRTPPARVLDLCTGSGAIGLACARAFTDAEVWLTDISPEALEVAEANRRRLGFDARRVHCAQGDLFAAVQGEFDLIVSNPPYVPEASYAKLPPEYRHEPKLALTADDEGLALVKRILREAPAHLAADGWLFLEVGEIAPAVDAWLGNATFEWVPFERGGDGVLVISALALRHFVQSPAAH